MTPKINVREISRLQRPALERHFLALETEDRRLRFGIPLSDTAVQAYVARIDFERDAAFGIFDPAELGVSVLPGHRGRGAGGALLARAHTHARNWGVRALFMHCLSENGAMMHLARKQGMELVAEAGEADAWLKLPPADATSHFGALFAQRLALYDYAFKTQLLYMRRVAEALTPGTASQDPEK
jgi:RimJ/RimL family protein N-acetyltransferase